MNPTPINTTRLGEYIFDKELAEMDEEITQEDGDFSDWHFDRMDRETELVEKW